jgi:hypothetical protein
MAEIFSTIKPLSNLTGISKPDGSFKLHSENLSSINFNGTIPKIQNKVKVSDLKPGQTVLVSDPSYSSSTAYITKIDSRAGFINDDANQPTTKYYVYHLSEFSMEQPFTYNATYGDSYSADAQLIVLRDDVERFVLGNDGWALTNNGNAIFSNVFARGTIEATSGKIDGILSVGENQFGEPLVIIGSNLFNDSPFQGISEKHSGILLNSSNYLLSHPSVNNLPITQVQAVNSSTPGFFYSATFTLPLETGEVNTLRVGDFIKLSGFTHANTTALNTTHQVTAVGTNTFTIAVSYNINLTSPVTINASVTSFALIKTYALSSMVLSSVSASTDSSTINIYFDEAELFPAGSEINLVSFLGDLSLLNGRFIVSGGGEGYCSITTNRVPAATYTSSLGYVSLISTVQKFKVGDNFNFMSFSSETGSLQLSGTITAHSGNFINHVYVGKAATRFNVTRKKVLNNIVTLRTSAPHGFFVGDEVLISDVDPSLNGTYSIGSTPSEFLFTYNKTTANIAEADLLEPGTAESTVVANGTVKVGVGESGITIDGTADPETSAIYAGEGNFNDADTAFFMDASGRFSIGDQLYFEDGNLTVGGTVTARAFAIDANNYWNTPGNLGDFRVGSANSYLFWNQTNSPNAGDGNLEVKGTIFATAGVFSGNIQTTGKIYSGTLDPSGLLTSGIEVASTGIKGIINGIASFILPADGVTKPTITNFEVLNAQITGDKENAFVVAGDVGVTANNVVIRGFRGGTDPTAAIYNTKNGLSTTYAGGTGFYFNDNGFFKVGTNTSNAKFDPTANSGSGLFTVTGTVNASAGTFTNTVYVGNNATASNNIRLIGTSTAATTAIGIGIGTLGYNTPATKFWADASGRFSLGSALTWDGTTLTISGVSGGIQPGNGIGVNASNQITTISGTSGITISSGGTSGARVQLDSGGLKAYNSGGINTVSINNDGSASFTGTVSGSTISGSTISGATVSGSTVIGGTVTTTSSGAAVALDGANNSMRFRNNAGSNVGWLTYLNSPSHEGIMINVGGEPLRDPAYQTSSTSPMLYLSQSGIYLTTNNGAKSAGMIVDEDSAGTLFIGNVSTGSTISGLAVSAGTSGMSSNGNITVTNGSIINNGTGAGTSRFQTIDVDSNIYGSANVFGNVVAGRALRIADSPYLFGTSSSSRRVKSYIDPIELTDELIFTYLQIQPVSYFYNSMIEGIPEIELEGKVREIGLIAEDLQDLGLNSLINVDDEGIADYVHYDKLSIYNIKMIQMQQERINQLENRLAALES